MVAFKHPPNHGGSPNYSSRGNFRGNFPSVGCHSSHGRHSSNRDGLLPTPQSSGAPQGHHPICQICEKPGHIAIDCYNSMNHAYQGRQPPEKLAAMVAAPFNPQATCNQLALHQHGSARTLLGVAPLKGMVPSLPPLQGATCTNKVPVVVGVTPFPPTSIVPIVVATPTPPPPVTTVPNTLPYLSLSNIIRPLYHPLSGTLQYPTPHSLTTVS
ncbi:hypothetical protein NE237_027188 [Protea cynaroides]|uniref:CCHC-type domain-containing protein n=1 Tax=Protea cynaroides TaxID=273540 RepID=A0A9Q0JSR3_9MAGN|nr:hypothetical protein NE237_027188 [Protea cynaroides]